MSSNFMWDYILSICKISYNNGRLVVKWILHRITNQSEIERICTIQRRGYHQTVQFASSLRLSKQLKTVTSIIFYPKPFTIPRILPLIIETKKLPEHVQPSVALCLHDLRIVNLICDKIDSYKKLKYSESNKEHVMEQLELLWNHLNPELRRSQDFICGDWSEIGFQGKDPTTDFRGMGLLGLYQLVYFSRTRTDAARRVLLDSNHPRRFIPFAVTGINISAFLLELLQDCKLHRYLLHNLPDIRELNDNPTTTAIEKNVIESGVNLINDVYCDIFEALMRLWVERDPPNVMSFQSIFKEFKESTASKFTAI
jgi:ELMO domain-containing protein